MDSVPVTRAAIRLLWQYDYTPKEIRNNGIIATEDPLETAKSKISKRELVALQARLNPVALEAITEDKAVFQMMAEASGVNAIPTVAVLFQGYMGRMADGSTLTGREAWINAMERSLPGEFVVKPARGALGVGVKFFRREGAGVVCLATGERASLVALLDKLAADSYYGCYLFQRRLRNCDEIGELTGSAALQTVRMTTLLGMDGSVRLLVACWRLGGASALTDNFRAGQGGSMVALLDTESGRIQHVTHREKKGRYAQLECHPVTGCELIGYQFPQWQAMNDLVVKAAKAFSPLRTIGWDVACTDTGPVIVEANSRWDPPNEVPDLREVIEHLQQGLAVTG